MPDRDVHAMASGVQGKTGVLPPARLRAVRDRLRRDRVERELRELGIRRSHLSNAPIAILVLLLVVAAGGATGAAITGKLTGEVAVGLGTAGVTVAGLLVAVLQWRAGLAEKAFDALYQRIALANQMRTKAFEGCQDESEVAEKREELYRFFVYTEIDSLEYAVRRYEFGLGMSAYVTERAVRHFRSRCRQSQLFTDSLAPCFENSGYFPETKAVVRMILLTEDPAVVKADRLLEKIDRKRLARRLAAKRVVAAFSSPARSEAAVIRSRLDSGKQLLGRRQAFVEAGMLLGQGSDESEIESLRLLGQHRDESEIESLRRFGQGRDESEFDSLRQRVDAARANLKEATRAAAAYARARESPTAEGGLPAS